MPEHSDAQLATILADAAKILAGQESLGKTANELVSLAVAVVPGAESAGLSLASNGKVETVAATDDLASTCDAAQYETGEGPVPASGLGGPDPSGRRLHRRTPLAIVRRESGKLGAGSLLACHLSSERGSLSALNRYAREPAAFDEQSRTVARIYAAHATIALEAARLEGDLRTAVHTRQGIGQAVGIVMERHNLTAKQAFDLLVRGSQQLNVKLRELADMIVSTGLDPSSLASVTGTRAAAHAELDQLDG